MTKFGLLRTAVLTALITYLLSLGAAVWAVPVYRYFYAHPVEWLNVRMMLIRSRKDIDEGIRNQLYFYERQRDEGKGVVAWQEGKTYGDYTFFFSAFDHKAYLIDFQGKILHQWLLDATKLPSDSWMPKREKEPWYPDAVWRAFLQPNGDVIALYCGTALKGKAFVSKGIFKVDKDSKLIWAHHDGIHHDVKVLPDGSILALLDETSFRPYPGAPFLKPPFSENFVVRLNNKGEEVSRVSVLDMFARSRLKKFLLGLGTEFNPVLPDGSLFHTNTITPITPEAAAHNPAMKAGGYLLSFRNFDLLAAVDLDAQRVTWASYGPWHGQHSPTFLPDGSLMMFDNQGNVDNPGGLSRILNVDTATGEVLWKYDAADSTPLFSWTSSSVDPLPNGNVLVTETAGGRIFEVSRDKQIVWDYRAPQRVKSDDGTLYIPNLMSGMRYRREDLPFLQDSAP